MKTIGINNTKLSIRIILRYAGSWFWMIFFISYITMF